MTDRPTLLLVHGAWHGSWAWDPLRAILESRGWTVATVDLPTVHSADKIGMHMQADADSVADAIAAINGPVVVVAHSYGGIPVTQAATIDNVTHIVYIAAFALDAGESLLGAVGGVAPDWWHIDGPLITAGDAVTTPQHLFFGDVDARVADASAARLLNQSVLAFTEELTNVAWATKPSTYLITEQDAVVPVPAQEALAGRAGSATVRMATSHSPFLSQPTAVAEVIERAAGVAGGS